MEESDVLRLLDVNLNRAAEGLRTLEDIARVVRCDVSVASWTKSLRHELARLASDIPRSERLKARAVHSDAGTALTSTAEVHRDQWSDLIAAAAERILQSLRVLEESSKRHFPNWSARCKQFRYQAYDRLAQIELRLTSDDCVFRAPSVYLLVDCQLPVEAFVGRLRQLYDAGVGLFQIRDKACEASVLVRFCRAAVDAVGADQVIVNDRVDIALASGARGVHVGQEDLPIDSVQRLASGRLWIGVSTHNQEQARAAQAAGADYIGCGPTFPSKTKQFYNFSGLDFLRFAAQEIDVPAYAIGGITSENLPSVLTTGVSRVAISSAIWAADSPIAEAHRFASLLSHR